MAYKHKEFPAWRYGPKGAAVIVNSEDETPPGFSAKRDKGSADEGTKTAVQPANGTTSAAEAAKTTDAKSRASIDVEKAAKAGVGGAGVTAPSSAPATADESTVALDAHGHAYDPKLHASTKSKTKAGLWRMKVGVKRPAPADGYPLDL